MSKEHITRVCLADDGALVERRPDGRESVVEGETDWERLAAKTDDELLQAAESDPDAQPLTADELAQARRIPDHVNVRAIRLKHKMSHAAFAQRYGFDPDALRGWEQGRRPLDRYVKILLTVIDKEPEAVERALAV